MRIAIMWLFMSLVEACASTLPHGDGYCFFSVLFATMRISAKMSRAYLSKRIGLLLY